ncbi:MAG: hypothetical protein AB2L14_10160 [Candidatus Xenobiia bacterium LiM19]
MDENECALSMLRELEKPVHSAIAKDILESLRIGVEPDNIIARLEKSITRAEHLEAFLSAVDNCPVFSGEYREKVRKKACEAGSTEEEAKNLLETLPSLDSVVRIHNSFTALPEELSCALRNRLHLGYDAESGMISLLHRVVYQEMNRRIAEAPLLLSVDGEHLDACQKRYLLLTEQKRQVVIEYIRQRWYALQKERLAAKNENRLKTAGAELKRRHVVRGSSALKMRQVIAAGKNIEGGDPLFNLKPVWMSSPDTVAQIFTREPFFDLIIFDEASQCRIEEALPLLLRESA